MVFYACAASASLADLLTGVVRPARVVGVLDSAVYLATDHPETPMVCLALPTAVRVPCAAVVGAGSLPTPRIGDGAQVGAGGVVVGDAAYRVGRWWQPPRPRGLRRVDPPALTAAADAIRRAVADPLDAAGRRAAAQLTSVLTGAADAGGLTDPVGALLGRGPGLTPLGDDVLAGMLVALRALAHPGADPLAEIVRATAPAATTAVSAALLRHAAGGECVPPLAAVLDAVLDVGDHPGMDAALVALLDVGHTSGAGLARGATAALDAAALSRPPVAVPSHGRIAP